MERLRACGNAVVPQAAGGRGVGASGRGEGEDTRAAGPGAINIAPARQREADKGPVAFPPPHPEHAVEELTGPSTDGLGLIASVVTALVGGTVLA